MAADHYGRLLFIQVTGEVDGEKGYHRGQEGAKFVDTYITLVTNKYNNKIKVVNYKYVKRRYFEMNYEDGTKIVWDYQKNIGKVNALRLIANKKEYCC